MAHLVTRDLHLELEGAFALPFEHVRELIAETLREAGVGGAAEVGLQVVDAARMRELNLEHRGVDAETDVLSFPIDGADEVPEGMPRQLGDIVICVEHVERQLQDGDLLAGRWSEELGEDADAGDAAGLPTPWKAAQLPTDTTMEQALRRCVVHSTLHLVGHDHDSPEAARVMLEREQRILDRSGA